MWPVLHEPSGHYGGPHGFSGTKIANKQQTKPMPRVTHGFRKSLGFQKLSSTTKQLNNSTFGSFGGPWPKLHGPRSHYMGHHGSSDS